MIEDGIEDGDGDGDGFSLSAWSLGEGDVCDEAALDTASLSDAVRLETLPWEYLLEMRRNKFFGRRWSFWKCIGMG
jgi:hypothetical protein